MVARTVLPTPHAQKSPEPQRFEGGRDEGFTTRVAAREVWRGEKSSEGESLDIFSSRLRRLSAQQQLGLQQFNLPLTIKANCSSGWLVRNGQNQATSFSLPLPKSFRETSSC